MEYSFKGYDELPVRTIQGLLESAIVEIGRLQFELDKANQKITELTVSGSDTKPETPPQPKKKGA